MIAYPRVALKSVQVVSVEASVECQLGVFADKATRSVAEGSDNTLVSK